MSVAAESLKAAVRTVAGADRSGWPGSARSEELVALLGARERLDAEIVRLTGEWEAGKDWAADGARSPVAWLANCAPLTRQDASTLVRTARHVHEHRATGDALQAGAITAAHAELAARAARHREEYYADHEATLLAVARELGPSAFRIAVQHWARCVDAVAGTRHAEGERFENRLDANATFQGIGHLDGRFDPVSFAALIARLDALEPPDPTDGPRPPRTLARRRADALMRLVHGDAGRAQTSVDVIIDVETLAGRLSPDPTTSCCDLEGFGPISPDLARTVACDGAIGRVLMKGRSEVLDLGRRTRLVTPALRRMLEIRDRTCVEAGCDVPGAWCDAHHIVRWWTGGETRADNLELRCRFHHLQLHARDPIGFRRGRPGTRGDPPDLDLAS